jgi:hypothetical protein
MTANQQSKIETPSAPPARARTSDVFSYPPSASPFDQDSKLWESIMPGPKPPLHEVVRRKVGALSDGLFQLPIAGRLSTFAERLPDAVPGWRRLGYASQWLILTVGGMALAFTVSWTLSRGASSNDPSSGASAHLAAAHTGAGMAANDVAEPIRTAHALQPSAPAMPAMPVAVSAPEPDAPSLPASSISNPDPGAAAPAELEPSDRRAAKAKTRNAKGKKKLAKAKPRTTKTRATTRSASR